MGIICFIMFILWHINILYSRRTTAAFCTLLTSFSTTSFYEFVTLTVHILYSTVCVYNLKRTAVSSEWFPSWTKFVCIPSWLKMIYTIILIFLGLNYFFLKFQRSLLRKLLVNSTSMILYTFPHFIHFLYNVK